MVEIAFFNRLEEVEAKVEKYLAGLSEYDKKRYLQLQEKNQKLRNELEGIAKATQDIMDREKDRKQKKHHQEEDEEVKKKTQILREQQSQLNFLKKKIHAKKRELDTAYQYPLVRQKEDELRNLKRILEELIRERESVLKVKNEQSKALKGLKFNKEEKKRKNELLDELKKIKQENKELVEKKAELEKNVGKNHLKIVNGKTYIRELKQRLHDFKKNNDGIDYKNITAEDVQNLKDTIIELDKQKKEMEIRHLHDLKNIEKMKVELKKENIRLDKLQNEKDKEMRLNSIKMKELKRLQRHRALKPIAEKEELEEIIAENYNNKSQGEQDDDKSSDLQNEADMNEQSLSKYSNSAQKKAREEKLEKGDNFDNDEEFEFVTHKQQSDSGRDKLNNSSKKDAEDSNEGDSLDEAPKEKSKKIKEDGIPGKKSASEQNKSEHDGFSSDMGSDKENDNGDDELRLPSSDEDDDN